MGTPPTLIARSVSSNGQRTPARSCVTWGSSRPTSLAIAQGRGRPGDRSALSRPGAQTRLGGGDQLSTRRLLPRTPGSRRDLDGSPFQQAYARVAPHPEQWHRLVAKIADLDRTIEG